MIVFGTCVGPGDSYERLALPSIEASREPDSVVLTVEGATSLCAAYNEMIDRCHDLDGVEALVLLHDDVVLQDRNLLPRIRRLLADPTVGVIGVVGAADLHDLRYWRGRHRYGRVWDAGGFVDHGPLRGDVDAVDGLLMVLSPAALARIRFDDHTYDGFRGYDADYCLACRAVGLRVVVEPFQVFHHSSGGGTAGGFDAANEAFVAKWSGRLAPVPLAERSGPVRRIEGRVRKARELTDPTRRELGRLADRLGRKARRVLDHTPAAPAHATEPELDGATPVAVDLTAPTVCVACGGTLEPIPGLPLRRCDTCGTGRTWPPPPEQESIFEHSYEGVRLLRRDIWMSQAAFRLGWVETLVPEGLVVEVGAATGEFVELAASRGFEAFGVEPNPWAAGAAIDAGVEMLDGLLSDWIDAFAGFSVDAVAMFHVLEHVEDPRALLAEARRILRPEGTIFIEIPNGGSDRARRLDPTWTWVPEFHHWHYTPEGLAELVAGAGFEMVELREFCGRPFTDIEHWELGRSRERAENRLEPSKDYLRVAARRAV